MRRSMRPAAAAPLRRLPTAAARSGLVLAALLLPSLGIPLPTPITVSFGLGVAAAQETRQEPGAVRVERVGGSDVAVDRRLARLLEADPLVIDRDTVVARGDTVHGPVLVVDATLILEGVITGDLVLVDAGAFVRPRSEVHGDLVNVAGGLYRSEVARVRGRILDLPTARYRVVREPDRIVIVGGGAESPLILDGFSGFHPPVYDRVNGVTAVVGASYRLPRLADLTPTLHAQGGWLTERGEPTYQVDLSLDWFATSVFAGHASGWATNDDWIRDDMENSLAYVWDGDDYRDYHDSERSWVGAARRFGDQEKRFHATLGVRGQTEDAASLAAGEPWHLLGDSVRSNPAIDPGRIASVIASFEMEWHGAETDFEGRVEYEGAGAWQGGDFAFDRVALDGDWAMHALADHTLEIEIFAQTPLGGGGLPRQRWSYVGGSGTLQTLAFGELDGDRVLFIESKYIVPLPERLALPFVGVPELQLIHAAGTAWNGGESRDVHQEIGARLQFFAFYVRYMVSPDGERDPDLDFGLSWPFDSDYPWERR